MIDIYTGLIELAKQQLAENNQEVLALGANMAGIFNSLQGSPPKL